METNLSLCSGLVSRKDIIFYPLLICVQPWNRDCGDSSWHDTHPVPLYIMRSCAKYLAPRFFSQMPLSTSSCLTLLEQCQPHLSSHYKIQSAHHAHAHISCHCSSCFCIPKLSIWLSWLSSQQIFVPTKDTQRQSTNKGETAPSMPIFQDSCYDMESISYNAI